MRLYIDIICNFESQHDKGKKGVDMNFLLDICDFAKSCNPLCLHLLRCWIVWYCVICTCMLGHGSQGLSFRYVTFPNTQTKEEKAGKANSPQIWFLVMHQRTATTLHLETISFLSSQNIHHDESLSKENNNAACWCNKLTSYQNRRGIVRPLVVGDEFEIWHQSKRGIFRLVV